MDLIGPLISLAIGLMLIAACGGFVAAEFSLITANRNEVEAAAESGDKRAGGVLRGMKTLSTQLSGAQLGITVTNLGIGFLAEPAIAALLGPALLDAGLSGEVAARSVSVTIALVLATGMTMIFGELVPKNMAIAEPLRTAKLVVGFQRLFTTIFGLPIRLFNGNANAVVRALGVEPQEELGSARSADELAVLVKRSADEGALAEETASLVQRTLAFGDRRAHDAMVPRGRMDSLETRDSVAQLLELCRVTGHSRLPGAGRGNEIAGVAHIRHGLAVPFDQRPTTSIETVMGIGDLPCRNTVPLDDLTAHPARRRAAHGRGGRRVRRPRRAHHPGGPRRGDRSARCATSTTRRWTTPPSPTAPGTSTAGCVPDEATQRLGVTVPEHEDYATLGGLITMELGRLAEVGDEVLVATDPAPGEGPARLRIEVVEVDGMRIETVHVKVEAAPEEDAHEEEER